MLQAAAAAMPQRIALASARAMSQLIPGSSTALTATGSVCQRHSSAPAGVLCHWQNRTGRRGRRDGAATRTG